MESAEQVEYQVYKEFQIAGKIGKGTYGVVFKAIHKKSKRVVAIKKIIDAFQNLIDAKRTYRQLNYLLQIEHPAIVRLEYLLPLSRKGRQELPSTTRLSSPVQQVRGYNTDKLAEHSVPNQKHVYAIFQHVETDLKKVLESRCQLQPIQRKFISYQLLHAVAYLHRSGVIHRDIKPDNILLNGDPLQVKLCDFGMARLRNNQLENQGVHTEYVASRWYRPPQALLGIKTCETSIDMWSVGCIIAEMAIGTALYPGKSTLDQLEVIFKSIGMPTSGQINKISSELSREVLRNFSFSRKAKFRPLKDILSMCSNVQIDLIIRLLTFDPSERMTAEEALQHEYFDEEVKKFNKHLEPYSKLKANIRDFDIKNQKAKGGKVELQIEDYQSFIQRLQKFVDRSTIRANSVHKTAAIFHQGFIAANRSIEGDQMRQKSTKESNFLTENKHQFLSQQKGEDKKAKDKGKKEAKKEKSSAKNLKNKGAVQPQHRVDVVKAPTQKIKPERLSSTEKPNSSYVFKKVKKSDKSLKQIDSSLKVCRSQTDMKQLLLDNKSSKQKSNHVPLNKSASKLIDNQSVVSKQSRASSNPPKSKSRSSKGQTDSRQVVSAKDDMVKRLAKPLLHLNKSGLVKCKSSIHGIRFHK